jgi:hypothetical protein
MPLQKGLSLADPGLPGRTPGQQDPAVAPAQIEIQLVSEESAHEGNCNHPGEFEVSTVGKKASHHEDGLAFEKSAEQYRQVSVVFDDRFQGHIGILPVPTAFAGCQDGALGGDFID